MLELFGAFSSQQMMPRWLLVLSAALSILLGILFVANPGAGAVGIAVLLGVTALIWGITLIAVGLSVRRGLPGPAHTSPTPA